MKTPQAGGGKTGIILLLALLLLICRSGQAQGDFQNLDFENPVLPLNIDINTVSASTAIPGWTPYIGPANNPTYEIASLFYDTISLGGVGLSFHDANVNNIGPSPIQGSYSVLLQGASSIYGSPEMQWSASIGQTATISSTAESLTYWSGGGALQVTFNGLPIDFLVTGSGAGYTIYSADISAYAGQNAQLLFTAPVNSYALLDNIQFSSSPVPEPGGFALTALGTVLFGCRRWKRL